MSFTNGPTIVTNGLVLALDAGDRNSYVSGSTTWIDLAGTNNGTLTNGPTFNTGSGGSIVFDGVDDYVSLTNQIQFERTSSFSFNIWFNFTTSGFMQLINNQNSGYVGYELAKGFPIADAVYLVLGNPATSNYLLVSITNPLTSNTWLNICSTYNGSSLASGVAMYLNGTTVGTTTIQDALGTQTTISNAPTLIGKRTPLTQGPFKGNIASVQIYNRVLSPQEVLQNYNATKGRFGL